MAELSPGSEFAGHRIEGIAGRGGFGVVYRARHLALDHVVALKLISSARAGEESFRERFKSESRIAVSIRHPNVVAVHNAGEEDGLLFVTMDFIEGTDLRGLLNREERLSPNDAVDIITQVASALDAAHAKGLVHRDIKPGNVLIDMRDGTRHVYLTDFGLSKQMDATSGLTASGAFVGTVDYVAPEQIKGQRLDARTDVYALACVAFELLSGDIPFSTQQEQVAKIYAHLQETPPSLVSFVPEVSQELSNVIERALSKDPDDRHPSAGDFARAAAAAVQGREPVAPERNVGIGAAAPTQTHEAPTPEHISQTVETTPPAGPESEEPEVPTVAASRPSADSQSRPPAGRLVGGALALGALAAGAWILLGGGSSDENKSQAPQPRGEPAALASGDSFSVPAEPVGVGVNGGTVWVSSATEHALTRLDARTGEAIGKPADLGGKGGQVAFTDDGDAWVAVEEDGGAGEVQRFRPGGGAPVTISVGSQPGGIAAGSNFVWVANRGSDSASRLNVGQNAEDLTITGLAQPARAVAGNADKEGSNLAQGIWFTNAANDSVTRITAEGDVVSTVQGVGANPGGIAVAGDDRVWVAAQDADALTVIQPASDPVAGGSGGEVSDTVDVGAKGCETPRTLAVGFGSIWATCADSAKVARVDETTGEIQDVVGGVGPNPRGIATDERGVWVTSEGKEATDEGIVTFLDPDALPAP